MAQRTIYGVVAGNGQILSGDGFRVLRQENGNYVIDFDPPFSSLPSVVGSQTGYANISQNTNDNVIFPFVNPNNATARTGDSKGTPTDRQFSFIAIGNE